MGTLRTQETEDIYTAYKAKGGLDGGCALCTAMPIETYKRWKIIDNRFPYDKVATVHHMVVPLQHLAEDEVSTEMWAELDELKSGAINRGYEFIIEATNKKKSIPAHFHLHLIVAKD